jgi:hypothetical protein
MQNLNKHGLKVGQLVRLDNRSKVTIIALSFSELFATVRGHGAPDERFDWDVMICRLTPIAEDETNG